MACYMNIHMDLTNIRLARCSVRMTGKQPRHMKIRFSVGGDNKDSPYGRIWLHGISTRKINRRSAADQA